MNNILEISLYMYINIHTYMYIYILKSVQYFCASVVNGQHLETFHL